MAQPDAQIENFERWDMPSGYSVYYRDSDHAYFWQTKEKSGGGLSGTGRLLGVSGPAGIFNLSKDGLMDWAAKQTLQSAADQIWQSMEEAGNGAEDAFEWAADGDSIWEYLRNNKATWRHRRDNRATEGSHAHRILEVALSNGVAKAKKILDELTGDDYGYAQAAISFVETEKPSTLMTEQVVASEELNAAGRFDAKVILYGEAAIVDAKTTSRKGTMESNHVQLAGYQRISDEAGFGETPSAYVLNLAPDGSYALHRGQASAEDFEAALTAYERSRALAKEIRAEAKRALEQTA